MKSQEIFEKNQVLTVAKAKELKGKLIFCTSSEDRANKPSVFEFVVGDIVSEWDDAANRIYPNQNGKFFQYDNFQQYWKSYMTIGQINECKSNLLLLDENGKCIYKCSPKFNNYFNEPTFFGSDADREVYFIEVGKIYTSNPYSEVRGYLETKEGNKFYNLFASYDAKLNIVTGEAWSITHKDYDVIEMPTINELIKNGILIDNNYSFKNGNN